MKKRSAFIFLFIFFWGCSSPEPGPLSTADFHALPPAMLEWEQGEKVELTGTIWPSRANTKYYIDTIDGKSAHLKSDAIDRLDAGTKLFLTGTVDYINDSGHFGAGSLKHSQTFFYVHVSDYRVLQKD